MTDRRRTDPITGEVVDDPAVRPFADWLREQSSGKTHDEMSESLWDLIARVQETGKKGQLILSISVEPMKGDESVLVVSDEIKLKLPEFPRKPSVFYADRNGNLTRSNPNQPELTGLRDVSSQEPTTLREVN